MGIPIPGGFEGVQESNYTALPRGKYGAVVVKAEHRDVKEDTAAKYEAENPGEQHPGVISWEFAIVEPEEYNNRKAWHTTSLTSKGRGMLKSVLLAVGYDEEELNSHDFTLDLDDARIVGARVELTCRPSRNDDTQTDVRNVAAPSSGDTSMLP